MGKDYVDADFEVISGPLRVGDEHPTNKGWYLTDRVNRKGDPLWYRPPGLISRWIRRLGIIGWCLLMAMGLFGAFFIEQSPQ